MVYEDANFGTKISGYSISEIYIHWIDFSLGWGEEIPWELQEILKTLKPSPGLYIFLGPRDSFIAWGPTFIRWIGLPAGLEDCLQSWLTPAGWQAGPPRFMTWGRKGAYFAASQYGEVDYHLGATGAWPIFEETVQDWESEARFSWSDLAVGGTTWHYSALLRTNIVHCSRFDDS